MLRRMHVVMCVVSAVLVFAAAASLQAETMAYSANADMVASENGLSPSGAFGQWKVGYADSVTLPATTAVDSTTVFGSAGLSGWGSSADGSSCFVAVNKSGAAYSAMDGDLNVDANELVFHVGSVSSGLNFSLLNWTAPRAGTVTIDTLCKMDHPETAINVYIGKNILGGSGGGWIVNQHEVSATYPTFDSSITDVSVVAGDTILLDVGYTGLAANSYLGVFHTITYAPIPEPSSMMILASAVIGLLVYAWRKRT
jgi:hypothetical protein